MKRSLFLTPRGNMPALSFEYDVETGELSGRDAGIAADIMTSAARTGFVEIEPHPQSHLLGDAPHSLADVSAIFGRWYVLPDWLQVFRPVVTTEVHMEGFDAGIIY